MYSCACGQSCDIVLSDVIGRSVAVYEAMESYFAENDDEITMKAGDCVDVISKSMDGWWKIRYIAKYYVAIADCITLPGEEVHLSMK